ncbi:MAG: glycosyltransferase [Butyrivibrio sp.]|jgi:rhamnosyltransferase|nr:glycosyltransferase [Butyrivibrio sp.]
MLTVDVIIPLYNPGKQLFTLLDLLAGQSVQPEHVILMNTEQEYLDRLCNEKELLMKYPKLLVKHLKRENFDHGETRNQGVRLSGTQAFMMMTQDALPQDDRLIEHLLKALEKPGTAVAYGRQLPDKNCSPEEQFARSFNYPDIPDRKSAEDLPRLGIKTYFCSNVCAMYRRDLFDQLGGFTHHTIFNEDMIYAGAAVQAGYAIEYVPDAAVIHSHNYSCRQQFHRNFDLGVSQTDHPEIFSGLRSESEGKKMVLQTVRYLKNNGKTYLVPHYIIMCGCRYIGYILGKNYRSLPRALVMRCTMNREYWKWN